MAHSFSVTLVRTPSAEGLCRRPRPGPGPCPLGNWDTAGPGAIKELNSVSKFHHSASKWIILSYRFLKLHQITFKCAESQRCVYNRSRTVFAKVRGLNAPFGGIFSPKHFILVFIRWFKV